jgi:Phage head-tail joining protein
MALQVPLTPIGTRDAKVIVEHVVDSSSGGFPDPTWEPLLTVWMQKVDLLGMEAWRADQMSARYEVRFIGPYHVSLDPETVDVPARQRLMYRGRAYDITTAAVVGHFEGIEYHARLHSGT